MKKIILLGDSIRLSYGNRVREYDVTGGVLTLPLSELSEVEIPKLYGGEVKLENLICVAPVIRKEA